MNAPRTLLSLSLSIFAGLSLGACDGDTIDGDGDVAGCDADKGPASINPEGQDCEVAGEAIECGGDEELVSYCSYMEAYEAAEMYGELSQGPCISPDENECEPGDFRSEPSNLPPGEEEDLCGGTSYSCEAVGGEPMWVEIPCNTPLVLSFDAGPIEMIAAEATPMATFDINMRADSCITTDWPTATTPWLAIDLDGNGSIDGGNELFGSGSRLADGRHATHGFAALAPFDTNGDGSVDALDARFGELLLWRDHDADRLSSPDELEPLAHAGIERLPVAFRVQTQCDERGNCGVQRAAFEFAGGVGELIDLYLSCH